MNDREVGETYVENGKEFVVTRKSVHDGFTITVIEPKLDPEKREKGLLAVRRSVERYILTSKDLP